MVYIKVAIDPYINNEWVNQYKITRVKLSDAVNMNNIRYIVIDNETTDLFADIANSQLKIPIMIMIDTSIREYYDMNKIRAGIKLCKKSGKYVNIIYV